MIEFTTKIAAAYLRGNDLSIDAIPALIGSIHTAIQSIVHPVAAEPLPKQPAVLVKKSVSPDALTCLECGKSQIMLKRHLKTAHELSVDEYRSKWSLPASYPMVTPNYAATRSAIAIQFGLGQKVTATAAATEDVAGTTASGDIKYPPSRWSKPTS